LRDGFKNFISSFIAHEKNHESRLTARSLNMSNKLPSVRIQTFFQPNFFVLISIWPSTEPLERNGSVANGEESAWIWTVAFSTTRKWVKMLLGTNSNYPTWRSVTWVHRNRGTICTNYFSRRCRSQRCSCRYLTACASAGCAFFAFS